MKSKEKILERIEMRRNELETVKQRYSLSNPGFKSFLLRIASIAKKRVSEFQQAFDFKRQMREYNVSLLEKCLDLDEVGVEDLLKQEREEGARARSLWTRKTKPVFDLALSAIKKVPKFIVDLEKKGFHIYLELEANSFNLLSFQIENDLEWVLND